MKRDSLERESVAVGKRSRGWRQRAQQITIALIAVSNGFTSCLLTRANRYPVEQLSVPTVVAVSWAAARTVTEPFGLPHLDAHRCGAGGCEAPVEGAGRLRGARALVLGAAKPLLRCARPVVNRLLRADANSRWRVGSAPHGLRWHVGVTEAS